MKPVEIHQLNVHFNAGHKPVHALNNITLSIEPGSVVGFIGPNGAGKTTTLHVLLGFVKPTSGSARIFGVDTAQAIARERIGFLPENPETYKFMTGRELVHFAGRLFGLHGQTLRKNAAALLDRVGLANHADRRTALYSRGMLQRLGIAQALINNPDLVILDEPTGGLDPIGRLDVRDIIRELRAQGKTVFFSSHELSEVETVCDRIVMLVAGSIAATAAVSELTASGISLERYFLNIVAGGRKDRS